MCENCGKDFQSKIEMNKHMNSKHQKVNIVSDGSTQCYHCKKKFGVGTHLKEHISICEAMILGKKKSWHELDEESKEKRAEEIVDEYTSAVNNSGESVKRIATRLIKKTNSDIDLISQL